MQDPATNDAGAELLAVRIPGLRGVTVPVTVDREVWDFFDGLAGAVRSMAEGTPLEIFRAHLEHSAREAIREGLEQGRSVPEAAESAGAVVSTYVVPCSYVWRVLEGAAQVPQAAASAAEVLAHYLARRPVHRAAVGAGLHKGMFPAATMPAVRRVLASAEAYAKRN